MMDKPNFTNYIVTKAILQPEQKVLEGKETLGFTIDASQSRKVNLQLRIVHDSEL